MWQRKKLHAESASAIFKKCRMLRLLFPGCTNIDKGVSLIQEQYHTPLLFAMVGKRGSRVYHDGNKVECEPYLNEDTIETTDAGGAFMACVLHGNLNYGLDTKKLYDMLEFAIAASLIFKTRKGVLKVMPEERDDWNFIWERKR